MKEIITKATYYTIQGINLLHVCKILNLFIILLTIYVKAFIHLLY